MLSSPGLGTLCPQTVETSEQGVVSEPAEATPQILSNEDMSMQEIANRRRQRKENDRKAKVNARHNPQAAPVEIITKEYPTHLYNSWIKCGHSEMQGRRPQMEDCLTVQMHFRTQPLHSSNGFSIGKQCLRDALQKETIEEVFVAIFDGHGGDKASKYAGAEMHKIFKRKIEQYELFKLQQKRLKKNPQDTLEDLGKPVKQSELLFHLHQYLRLPNGDHLHLFPPAAPTATEISEKKEEEPTTTTAIDDSEDDDEEDHELDEEDEEDEEEIKLKAMTKLVVVPSPEPLDILSLPESETIQLLMREAFIEVNESMAKNGVPHGTTASAVYLQPQNGKCYVANVGDSRILLHRGGKSYRLTVDHRPNDEDEEQRVKESGGRITNQRVNGMLAVTRAIGDSFLEPFVTADPYTTCIQLCDEDEFLIVACDGVWDFVPDEEVCTTVQQEEDPRRASVQVRDLAYSKGSTDNISAIVLRFVCKQACEPAAKAEACQEE